MVRTFWSETTFCSRIFFQRFNSSLSALYFLFNRWLSCRYFSQFYSNNRHDRGVLHDGDWHCKYEYGIGIILKISAICLPEYDNWCIREQSGFFFYAVFLHIVTFCLWIATYLLRYTFVNTVTKVWECILHYVRKWQPFWIIPVCEQELA